LYKHSILTLVLLTFVVVGCGDDNGTDPELPGTINGTVASALGGDAIVGATVTTSPATRSDVTNMLGEFTIENVPPGYYSVIAAHDSFTTNSIPAAVTSNDTTVADVSLAWACPTSGLIAYYPLDGDASDESINDNHGTVIGAVPVTDRFGRSNCAFDFDGLNDYIRVPYNSIFDLTDALTAAAWVTVVDDGDIRIIINKGQTWDFHFGYTGQLCTDMPGSGPYFCASVAIVENAWHHAALTIGNDHYRLYFDGQLVADSLTTVTMPTDDLDLHIGNNSPTPWDDAAYNGNIDEVRVYNRALTEEEIRTLYNEH